MNRKTNKTAPLLRLLTRSDDGAIINPIIDDNFKEGVIYLRSNVNNPVEEKPEVVEINIISELISEWLPQTKKRFNSCDCALCRADITVAALNEIPAKYVRISDETDFKEIEALKEKYRAQVISTLVKLVLRNHTDHRKIS